jgi:hypothetical protein
MRGNAGRLDGIRMDFLRVDTPTIQTEVSKGQGLL